MNWENQHKMAKPVWVRTCPSTIAEVLPLISCIWCVSLDQSLLSRFTSVVFCIDAARNRSGRKRSGGRVRAERCSKPPWESNT